MTLKLITEVNESLSVTEELNEEKGKKEYFIQGTFLQGNIKNRNGRSYPIDILEREVNKYIESHVKSKRAFGELGHPEGPSMNLDRVSHIITELKRDGDNFIGKAKIMDTPMGQIVKNFIDEGAGIGVSSRALGSVKNKNGVNEVQNDLHLITAADIVADPSAPDAFVQGIMEGKEWIEEGGVFKEIHMENIIKETQEKVQEIVKETKSKHEKELAYLEEWYNFISKLSN